MSDNWAWGQDQAYQDLDARENYSDQSDGESSVNTNPVDDRLKEDERLERLKKREKELEAKAAEAEKKEQERKEKLSIQRDALKGNELADYITELENIIENFKRQDAGLLDSISEISIYMNKLKHWLGKWGKGRQREESYARAMDKIDKVEKKIKEREYN